MFGVEEESGGTYAVCYLSWGKGEGTYGGGKSSLLVFGVKEGKGGGTCGGVEKGHTQSHSQAMGAFVQLSMYAHAYGPVHAYPSAVACCSLDGDGASSLLRTCRGDAIMKMGTVCDVVCVCVRNGCWDDGSVVRRCRTMCDDHTLPERAWMRAVRLLRSISSFCCL